MMNDEEQTQVLQERARILARKLVQEDNASAKMEVALCTVGAETFALPVAHLREIVLLPKITRLPFAPAWFLGIAQVRGSLLVVLDLGAFFGVKGESEPEHLAVIEGPQGPLGVTLDSVLSCQNISTSDIRQGSSERSERRATLGLTTDLAVIVDIPRLLSLPEVCIK